MGPLCKLDVFSFSLRQRNCLKAEVTRLIILDVVPRASNGCTSHAPLFHQTQLEVILQNYLILVSTIYKSFIGRSTVHAYYVVEHIIERDHSSFSSHLRLWFKKWVFSIKEVGYY